MIRKQIHIIIVSLGIVLMWTGCTADSADDRTEGAKSKQHELCLSMGANRFEGATRASGDLPSGYTLYNYATELAPIHEIVGFMTYMEGPSGSKTPAHIPCYFFHQGSGENHIWTSRIVLQDGTYYLYGYMPEVSTTGVSITPKENDFSKGAVITLTGLNAITPDDICVINGFKQYQEGGSVPDMSTPSAVGEFTFNSNGGDNLYLLASHIYAGLKFQMKLDATYAALRKIKLKSLRVIPAQMVKTITATITLSAGSESPVGVVFATETEGTTETVPAVIYDGEGKELTTTDQEFLACLCPILPSGTQYILETTYDVYDQKDNPIREGETVRNVLTSPSLAQGEIHTVSITVQPTYLYMLSEPDLDNPTFRVTVGS